MTDIKKIKETEPKDDKIIAFPRELTTVEKVHLYAIANFFKPTQMINDVIRNKINSK